MTKINIANIGLFVAGFVISIMAVDTYCSANNLRQGHFPCAGPNYGL